MNKKVAIALICVIILAAITVCVFVFTKSHNTDFVKYETELLGIDFEKYVISSSGENDIKVKFEINPDLLMDFQTEVENNMEECIDFFTDYGDSNIGKEVKADTQNMTVLKSYQAFRDGTKGAKTRDIYAFLCQDGTNCYFLIYG